MKGVGLGGLEPIRKIQPVGIQKVQLGFGKRVIGWKENRQ